MTWAQFALLLSRHIGEVPNILAKGKEFIEAPPFLAKNEAFRGLSEAFDPILADLDSSIGTMATLTEAEAEASLLAAFDASPDVSAAGLLDRLKQLKELYKLLQPYLGLIGIPAPPLPFHATTA